MELWRKPLPQNPHPVLFMLVKMGNLQAHTWSDRPTSLLPHPSRTTLLSWDRTAAQTLFPTAALSLCFSSFPSVLLQGAAAAHEFECTHSPFLAAAQSLFLPASAPPNQELISELFICPPRL